MTPLRDLQSSLLDALLGTAPDQGAALDHALSLIDAPAPAAAARLAVYRNTLHSTMVEALRSTYPAVWRLVGEDYFRQVARDFGRRHPSRSGDLLHVGEDFPAYLAALHEHDAYRYLGDVARLELLVQEALLAAEPTPLDLSRLARVAPADYDSLKFILHPALRLFESPYPVRRIWESNVGSEAEPAVLDLSSGGDRLAVLRRHLQLQFHPLNPGEWCLLKAFGRGEPFAASIEAAQAGDGGFDAAVALRRCVALGAIVSFE